MIFRDHQPGKHRQKSHGTKAKISKPDSSGRQTVEFGGVKVGSIKSGNIKTTYHITQGGGSTNTAKFDAYDVSGKKIERFYDKQEAIDFLTGRRK